MKPLTLTDRHIKLRTYPTFDVSYSLAIELDSALEAGSIYIHLSPDQVNELITHLAACLKHINKPVDILAPFKVLDGQIITPRGPNQLSPGSTNDPITPPDCLKQPEEFTFNPELLTNKHYIVFVRRDDGVAAFGKYIPEEAEYYKTVKVLYTSTNWDEVVAVARNHNNPIPDTIEGT